MQTHLISLQSAKRGRAIRRVMNIAPRRGGRLLLALIPFVLIALVYVVGSAERRAANPDDKLLPPVSEMVESIGRLAFEEDRRSGEIVLWADTAASMQRLLIGLAVATLIGLAFGLTLGLIPVAGAGLGTFTAVLSMIPPMAILPILFIVFGLGELSKVVLIVFGIAPFLIRDLALSVESLPREQLIKAQSLGASTWQIAIRVVLPQIMPRLIEALRLSLGPAFLFLISAEAIAADLGLGYRIFLVRRYLSMDVILPYVAWITLLAYLMDFALAWLARRGFAWAYAGRIG
jgi:NitT/TauT family transport system permease protein